MAPWSRSRSHLKKKPGAGAGARAAWKKKWNNLNFSYKRLESLCLFKGNIDLKKNIIYYSSMHLLHVTYVYIYVVIQQF